MTMNADPFVVGMTQDQFAAFQALVLAAERFYELAKNDPYWEPLSGEIWVKSLSLQSRLEAKQVSVVTPFNEV